MCLKPIINVIGSIPIVISVSYSFKKDLDLLNNSFQIWRVTTSIIIYMCGYYFYYENFQMNNFVITNSFIEEEVSSIS
jgi:hypothetical protein